MISQALLRVRRKSYVQSFVKQAKQNIHVISIFHLKITITNNIKNCHVKRDSLSNAILFFPKKRDKQANIFFYIHLFTAFDAVETPRLEPGSRILT